MNTFFELLLVFIVSATGGWLLEVIYRSSKQKQMINPGFLVGPCLPIYGTGGTVLYLLCSIDLSFINSKAWQLVFLLVVATILMTVIEYIAGWVSLKYFHNRLWDYSNRWGNIQGIICPLFSLIWGVLCVVFYFLIFPWMHKIAIFASTNVLCIFAIGLYFGTFLVDLCYSLNVMNTIRNYAIKIKKLIDFENLKRDVGKHYRTKRGFPLSSYSFNLYNRIKKFIEDKKIYKQPTIKVEISNGNVGTKTDIKLEDATNKTANELVSTDSKTDNTTDENK